MIVLSEYGIRDVSTPIHLNRVFREHGLIAVRDELGHEMLDPGASAAFAVADHQVAHVYVNDRSRSNDVRRSSKRVSGVEQVLGEAEKRAWHIAHERAGDLIAVAAPHAWFTYYFWLDDRRAPDFARTVEIHRKPGYDPVELFLDPAIRIPPLTVGWKLMKRKAGFRSLLDVIPLDATPGQGLTRTADRLGRRWPGVHQPREGAGTVAADCVSRCVRVDIAASWMTRGRQNGLAQRPQSTQSHLEIRLKFANWSWRDAGPGRRTRGRRVPKIQALPRSASA